MLILKGPAVQSPRKAWRVLRACRFTCSSQFDSRTAAVGKVVNFEWVLSKLRISLVPGLFANGPVTNL